MDQIVTAAVVAFAKNPKTEKYKTRLLDDIQSPKIVEKTYELLLKITSDALEQVAAKKESIQSFWAINAAAEDLPNYFAKNIDVVPQGQGGLGERLSSVYNALKKSHSQVIIIGSDLPFLSTDIIEQTLLQLKNQDIVIGPSDDGGFYLFASKLDLQKNFWTSVQYSQNSTLEQLIGSLKDIRVGYLPVLTDVDDLASFVTAMASMKKADTLSKSQQQLISFFESEIEPLSTIYLTVEKDLIFQDRIL